MTSWNEFGVSRAQWSIDACCPKENNVLFFGTQVTRSSTEIEILAMAEQRFTNGSVNLKAKKRSQSEGYPLSLSVRMQEENLYEEMNVKNRGTKQTTDTNVTTLLIHKNEDLMRSQLNLTAEIQNLTEQIKLMKKELSLCPEKACQEGWLPFESSCYAINDAKPHEQKTWEEARKNCKGKISDLAVVINAAEKKYISEKSWGSSGNKGYWIGLRVEGGKWKWVDGSYLTDNSWIQQPPSDGLCVISVENQGFKSVSCDKKNQWICKKRP
ncbi:C-type lectin domain family 4 member G isoform X2 [Oreochromis niloticus]|uniref:C-type lectin domain family 4 member G isoform X2 n=1 Tax=Oreochromis niloticus TaxID=8128 RepID=UPI000393E597|nr:C-type lectin domain family 4 member G isoform X2 [Oreochromis niloticus]